MLTACAGGGSSTAVSDTRPVGKVSQCKSGDTHIADSSQCLQDEAACYPLTDGSWCTGPRGETCPNGTRELKSGQSCPSGAKCFKPSASLHCVIDL
ncbi:hypothetical protein Q4485_07805 [Granulosicoccaceae sp. 1_MG-2023]|nr:hypothetical protein [Granulosicoccaceae sp. 1_MG-2023]